MDIPADGGDAGRLGDDGIENLHGAVPGSELASLARRCTMRGRALYPGQWRDVYSFPEPAGP